MTGQGKASLQMEWKENSFVYIEKGGKGIAPFEIPAQYPHFLSNKPEFLAFNTRIIPAF